MTNDESLIQNVYNILYKVKGIAIKIYANRKGKKGKEFNEPNHHYHHHERLDGKNKDFQRVSKRKKMLNPIKLN